MVSHLPEGWLQQWTTIMGIERGQLTSVLEDIAGMAGVLLEADYERATLAMRDLSTSEALAAVTQQAASLQMQPDPHLPLPEQLIDLQVRILRASVQSLGYSAATAQRILLAHEPNIAHTVRILRDGDLHSRFWFWLDRFYFEVYRPWRATRLSMMDELRKKAMTALGGADRGQTPPDLSWLPAQNPALRTMARTAIEQGQLQLCLWVDPFQLFDSWTIQPGMLIVSFAEPGRLYENFREQIHSVAERTNALADPTRLTILRMIRHFDMVNTDIADYLQLARPTVSIHAKILREAGLIRSHQEGRMVRHELVAAEVRRLFRDLEKVLDLPPETDA
ncbi:hypothetical protein KTT_36660 [Tengunoibacter tsumagoiensis]|uniref:HTH arsR-type domain-containing protein n=2 Tax=Tengunoibacter tsumagoiensis TaxID=2014871 RepID=A0A402A3S9_9CHLR|nr:hypothetical protein KTT_36660 [Tengunoibacter tsumagoiensis]